jgi:hypothetical protein
MELSVITDHGITAVEGPPDQPLIRQVTDTSRLIEACWSHGADAALLHVSNLTPGFFALRTGEAGEILQKLQTYRIRLAVVCPPGSVSLSPRFRELLDEAHTGRDFGVFESRAAALAWLAR